MPHMSFPVRARSVASIFFAVALSAAAGCSSNSGGGGNPPPDGGTGGPLSFQTDVFPILQGTCMGCQSFQACTACHAPSSGTLGGLDLTGDAMTVYGRLFNMPPPGTMNEGDLCVPPTITLPAGVEMVVPSDSGKSLLYNKLAAAESGGPTVLCGAPMPLGLAPLAASEVTTIKTWIDDGAMP